MFSELFDQSPDAGSAFSLMTDQYQLAMAYSYWKNNSHNQQANFQLYFRKNPFNGAFVINAGLQTAIDFLQNFGFQQTQIDYLQTLTGSDGKALFDQAFLDYLLTVEFECDVVAIPEGEVVFPNEPIMQITGPIIQAQIIESTLLNIINFQCLVATKAARMRVVAGEDRLFEFGLRRSQGLATLSVARASYIGGFNGTSNLLAGQILDIPTVGTHAHSWVMAYDSELAAFQAFAKAMPNNAVFLVDTYNTPNGIDNAIKVGLSLREQGHEMLGIRLDSGDLAYFSKIARDKLDAAGFPDAAIMASNELDEHVIESLKVAQKAEINTWGVGTKLATCYDDAALSGVYKLTAIQSPDGEWQDRIKLSEQRAKMTIPGQVNVYRYLNQQNICIADAITLSHEAAADIDKIIDPQDSHRQKKIKHAEGIQSRSLLQPIFDQGKLVYDSPSLHEIRDYTQQALQQFDLSHKRLAFPHSYPVGLSNALNTRRDELMHAAAEQYQREVD